MSDTLGPTELEQQIIELCGLSKLLAPGLLRRALSDVGAASPPGAADLLRALPMLESRMRAYLPPDDVRERLAKMRRLLGDRPEAAASAHTTPRR
jgi:hypothetical protein